MKNYFLLILISFFSLIASISILFLITETFFRIQKKGFKDGVKSYFIVEAPYSALGTNSWVISDDELGYRLNPNLEEINDLSMKGDEITIPKPKNVKRIVILGDSVPYVGDPSFVEILKKKFEYDEKIEIINASTPGYTNYQELIFLKRYILKIEPDIVLLSYVLNDNYKFLHKFDENEKMLWTDEAEKSLLINNIFDKFISKSYFLSSLKLTSPSKKYNKTNNENCLENSIDFNTAWKDESWIDVDRQLQEMNTLLNKQQAKFLIVIFPLKCQIQSNFLQEDFDHITKPQQKLLEYGKKYEIPTLNLFMPFLESFDKNKDLSLYVDQLHLSDRGHQLSAQEISKFISNNLGGF